MHPKINNNANIQPGSELCALLDIIQPIKATGKIANAIKIINNNNLVTI